MTDRTALSEPTLDLRRRYSNSEGRTAECRIRSEGTFIAN
jgi:hypothetical protein